MSITFEQKTRILTQVADPGLWKSRLNMAWLMSDRRAKSEDSSDKPLESTKLIQRMSFDLTGWEGVPLYKVVNGVKLTLAKDLGIEPELKAYNEIDKDQWIAALRQIIAEADEYKYDLPGHKWKGDKPAKGMTDFEKAWLDSTEFGGLAVGLPRRFFIERTPQGFDIATSLDFREWIIAHGTVVGQVMSKGAKTIAAPQDTLPPDALLQTLDNGHTMRDHNGQEWNVAVLEHVKPYRVQARYAREAMTQNFALEGYDYAVIAIDEGLTLVAMRSDVLLQTIRSYRASQRLMDAILKGVPADVHQRTLFKEVSEAGADIRYLRATDGGRLTFLDAMLAAGQYEMAADWCAYKGIPRNYALQPPEPAPKAA